MDERTLLGELGQEIEAKHAGSVSVVSDPRGKNRPWVVHVYRVSEKQLAQVNADVASRLVDALDRLPTLDAVGMAHSAAATEQYYSGPVLDELFRRTLVRTETQMVLGTWSHDMLQGISVCSPGVDSPSESEGQWAELIQTLNEPFAQYDVEYRMPRQVRDRDLFAKAA